MVKKHSDDYQDFSYITNPFLGSTKNIKKNTTLGISSLISGFTLVDLPRLLKNLKCQ